MRADRAGRQPVAVGRPDPRLVRPRRRAGGRHPGHRPPRAAGVPGLPAHPGDPGARHRPRRDLCVPVVRPQRQALRPRPRHPVQPRPPRARRPDGDRQPRPVVQAAPPAQDPGAVALRDDRARGVHLDQPARQHLPPRPHRQPTDRPRPGPSPEPTTFPTGRTPTRPTSDHHAPDPASDHRRGHRHVPGHLPHPAAGHGGATGTCGTARHRPPSVTRWVQGDTRDDSAPSSVRNTPERDTDWCFHAHSPRSIGQRRATSAPDRAGPARVTPRRHAPWRPAARECPACHRAPRSSRRPPRAPRGT